VIAEGWNCVTSTNDPTAHAEVVAIRNACSALGRFDLQDCEIYTSCEPCLMCMGAIYWSRMRRVFYSSRRADAAKAGFDDEHIYTEITLPPEKRKIPAVRLVDERSELAFDEWVRDSKKTRY
jgi:guanine deaminase